MQLILPEEVKGYENCMSWLDKLKQISDVKLFDFVDIRQSMMNGGGPACLRLKVILNDEELESLNQNFLMNSERLESIKIIKLKESIEMCFILMILRIQIYLMRAEES